MAVEPEPDITLEDIFESTSPSTYRYKNSAARRFTSGNADLNYQLKAEVALAQTLEERTIAPIGTSREIAEAIKTVKPKEVARRERTTKHNVRALVEAIQSRVSPNFRRFVHLGATSYDTLDTASAARLRDLTVGETIPALTGLEAVLIDITLREAGTLQIGRTHGQHAVPITFGFAMAWYVSRLGKNIEHLSQLAGELEGKFSGATGSYNASSLLVEDPEELELDVLGRMDLNPAEISTQIVPPEPQIRLSNEYTISIGIMANLGDDMRHLQRTEIGEVGEKFEAGQAGSSTMPQKQNPINFEFVKSIWKKIFPGVETGYLNQISEHQRDLTGSAADRWTAENLELVSYTARRLAKTMSEMQVNKANMMRNFAMTGDQVVAEAYYILLSYQGHPDAHTVMRRVTQEARENQTSVWEIAGNDPELRPFFDKMSSKQLAILADPTKYTGIAEQKAISVAEHWKEKLNL